MVREEYFRYIEDKLLALAYKIDANSKLNLLDSHIHAETFYRDFFNKLFGLKLENANSRKANIKAIDLIDKSKKIIIQVSATNTVKKIQDSLSKIVVSLYPGYTFKFISISKDAKNLKNKKYDKINDITFDPAEDIYDISTILNKCLDLETPKLKTIYLFFKSEFESTAGDSPSNKTQFHECDNIEIRRKTSITKRSSEVVEKIENYILGDLKKDISDTCFPMIYASSGEGKTTIAVEVAFKIRANFPITIWINAQNPIQTQFVSFFVKNKLIEKDKEREEITIEQIVEFIKKNRILIIFDAVRYITDVETYIPRSGVSRIVMTSTNATLHKEDCVKSFRLQKLSIQDAEGILFQGVECGDIDSKLTERIIKLFDYSPFGLELVNSYIKNHPGLDLDVVYDDITKSAKVLEVDKKRQFGTINSASSISALLHKTFIELDENNPIDNLCLDLLKYVRLLNLAYKDYTYRELENLLKFDEENAANKRTFSEIKQRLLELGLAELGNDVFVIHSFVINYVKELPNEIKHITTILDSCNNSLIQTHDFWSTFGVAINQNDFLKSYGRLMNFFKSHFPSEYYSKDRQPSLRMLMDEYCSMMKYNELLQICDDKYLVSDDDHFFIYMKALALHNLECWEDALLAYQSAVNKNNNFFIFINSLLYIGHIYSHLKKYEDALFYYSEANSFLQQIEVKNMYKNNPIELLILQARCHLYLLNLYKLNCNEVASESQQEKYNSKLTEILRLQGISDDVNLKNIDKFPFMLRMEMLNDDLLKPASIKHKVRLVKCN